MGAHYIVDKFKKTVTMPCSLSDIHDAVKEIAPDDKTKVTCEVILRGRTERKFVFDLTSLEEVLEILELNSHIDSND